MQIGTLVISDVVPSGTVVTEANQDDWIWLNPDTGVIRKFNPATSQFDLDIPVPSHEHLMSAITGLVDALAGKAPAFTGLTGTRTIDGHTLTFTNGVLTGYEAP